MVRRALLVSSLIACAGVGARADEGASKPAAGGFALVELFTSEGCSSCPPADDAAADIARDAASRGTPVYVLAFHVDYWDYLGWKDPYAKAEYSSRQRAYAKGAGSQRVYTPQMVVNGAAEFVGSDREHARTEIASALERAADSRVLVSIEVDPRVLANVQYAVRYEIAGLSEEARKDAMLHVAVVESGLSTEVTRGENAGETLRHDRVVRWFDSRALGNTTEGSLRVHVPGGADMERTSVVMWVQAGDVGPVLGAGEASIRSTAGPSP